jgi:hypothetical protein
MSTQGCGARTRVVVVAAIGLLAGNAGAAVIWLGGQLSASAEARANGQTQQDSFSTTGTTTQQHRSANLNSRSAVADLTIATSPTTLTTNYQIVGQGPAGATTGSATAAAGTTSYQFQIDSPSHISVTGSFLSAIVGSYRLSIGGMLAFNPQTSGAFSFQTDAGPTTCTLVADSGLWTTTDSSFFVSMNAVLTVTPIPAPTAGAALGLLGVCAAIIRRRRT